MPSGLDVAMFSIKKCNAQISFQVTKADLEKLKATYRQLTREAHTAKEKYKEAMVKGVCVCVCVCVCVSG